MFSKDSESPLVRLYRTEYTSDYLRMKKLGYELTESDVKSILGYPTEKKTRFFGLF